METKSFKTAAQWRKWLDRNHAKSRGIWMKMYKKASGIPSVDYKGALMEALCYGWIDGQSKSLGEEAFLQKFTPRRKGSVWSKRNIGFVGELEKEGRMMDAGREQVKIAQENGRWDAAYDSPRNMQIPEAFLDLVRKNKKAKAFFDTLNKTNRYAIAWRIATAKKEETKVKRMKAMVEMLARGEKFH